MRLDALADLKGAALQQARRFAHVGQRLLALLEDALVPGEVAVGFGGGDAGRALHVAHRLADLVGFGAHALGQALLALGVAHDALQDLATAAVNDVQRAHEQLGQLLRLVGAGMGGEIGDQRVDLGQRQAARGQPLREVGDIVVSIPTLALREVGTGPDGAGADGRHPALRAGPRHRLFRLRAGVGGGGARRVGGLGQRRAGVGLGAGSAGGFAAIGLGADLAGWLLLQCRHATGGGRGPCAAGHLARHLRECDRSGGAERRRQNKGEATQGSNSENDDSVARPAAPGQHAAAGVVGDSRGGEGHDRDADDHRAGQGLELQVEGEAHEFHRMGEGVELADPIQGFGRFAHLPKGVQGGGGEEHREDHEVHHAGEVLQLPDLRGDEQADRAQHHPRDNERRQSGEEAERRDEDVPERGDGEEDVDLHHRDDDPGEKLGEQQRPAREGARQQHPHRADLAVVDHRQRGLHAGEELDHHRQPRRDVFLVKDVGVVGRNDGHAQRRAEAGGEDEQPDQRPHQGAEEALLLVDELEQFALGDAGKADPVAGRARGADGRDGVGADPVGGDVAHCTSSARVSWRVSWVRARKASARLAPSARAEISAERPWVRILPACST